MILIRLIRHARGYVRFRASGALIERFLNLLAKQRISVWDIKRREQALTGCVAACDYPHIRPLAKKAGVRLRIAEKKGLPFKRKKLTAHRGLLVGAGVFVLFLFVMTRFIWTIEVQGNEQIPTEAITRAMEDIGIRPGTLRAGIDVRQSERLLMLAIRELGWIALNVDGSTIYVVVSEADLIPPMVNPDTPGNIVASHSGQLLELRVYEGQRMLRPGEAVLKGQVIVSGITQDGAGHNLLRHARADAIAQVVDEIEIRVPLSQTRYEPTGRSARRNFLRVLGFEAPLFLPRNIQRPYIAQRTETDWQMFGAPLPISHRSETFTLMKEVPFRYTEEQAMQRALAELEVAEAARFYEAEIIGRTLAGRLEEDTFVLRADYIVHMNIAQLQEIFIEGDEMRSDNK